MTQYWKLAALAAFVATPAFAQTAPAPADDDTTVADSKISPDIIVAAGVAQYRSQIGQAVTVIDRATIEQRQTISIADLLATTPGVTISRNGGLGTTTSVRIRGAEGEQTLTIIDGVRVNDPSSPGGGFDFANLLAGSIDHVEVLRGPNSVPWGSQAIGGVVNIVTAAPREGLHARGSVEYGSNDTVYANAGISGSRGALSGALTGGYLRTDGISAAADGTEADGYRQYGATGRVGLELADGIGIDLRGYYADSRVMIDGLLAPDYVLGDTPEYSTAQESYGYAGAYANLLGGRFKNRVGFTISDINRNNYASPVTNALEFIGRGRSERYEYQGDFQVVDQLRLVGGAEHEDSRFLAKAFGDFPSRDTHASGITSFYGEAIATPVRQLTVTGGIRHDQNSDFGGHFTYGVDAALSLDTGTTFRASYGEGFKAPSLYQRYAAYYGNHDLKPETAKSYDFGISQSLLGGRAKAGVTYFHRDTTNQINFDNATFVYINIDQTRAKGIEFELALTPIDALTLTGNFSYIDATNRTPGATFGNDLARRPKETASVSADYRLPFGLALGGTITLSGDSFDDAANTKRLDGYALTGLRAELPIGKRLSVYGRVDNLFDVKYETVNGYGTYGRTVFGGVRVKLD